MRGKRKPQRKKRKEVGLGVDEEGGRRDWWMEGWREEGRMGGVGGQGDWRARRRKLNEMSSSYKGQVNIS
jgi:hypothetical protein